MATKLTSRNLVVCGDVMQRRDAHFYAPKLITVSYEL